MNLFNKNWDNLTELQFQFWKSCIPVLRLVNNSILDARSYVELEEGVLVVSLIHKLDTDTNIVIRVDKYEILFSMAGMTRSMMLEFPMELNAVFFHEVNQYLRDALSGKYRKICYLNANGDIVKSKLEWEGDIHNSHYYTSLSHMIRMKLGSPDYRSVTYEYSGFLREEENEKKN